MIKVIISNATGSSQVEGELYPESGLVTYVSGEKKLWETVSSLKYQGSTVFEKIEGHKAKESPAAKARKKKGE